MKAARALLLAATVVAPAQVLATGLVGRECPGPPPVDCELYTAVSDTGPWSPCAPADDGKYYRTKVLGIKTPAANNGTCPDENDPRRKIRELCPAADCIPLLPSEDTGPFGDCEDRDNSGKFFKYKILGVKTPESNGGKCDPKDREYREPCVAVDCVVNTPAEDTGVFGNCTDKDNSNVFYKYRVLGIKVEPSNGGKACPPVDSPLREDKQLCVAVPCVVNTPEEDKGNFTDCEPERDSYSGKWYKYKTLGIKTDAQFGGSCPSVKEREYKELCPAQNCIPFTPEEDTGEYGQCLKNSTDGKFYKSKTLGVKVNATYGGSCDPKDRQFSELCAAIDCVLYTKEEDPNPYGNCTDRDGSGKFYKYKILGIKSEAQFGGVDCPAEDNPIREVSEFCEPVDCVPLAKEEDNGPYGNCTDRDNTNVFYKYRTLGIKVNATNGGKCDPKDREDKELCPAVPCVVNTPEEDTGNFTDCEPERDSYSGKWYKYKTLGIKTPAENGGSCPTEAEREYKELCPAQNCIPFTPEEDTGEYGPCAKNATDGKFYKTKTLGVKVNATYGGSCDEKDRQFSELCAAIDCVLFTEQEDPKPYGNCTDRDGSGKFYKYKILGIKSEAQFGGVDCPAEDNPIREVKQFCEPVDCVPLSRDEDNGPYGNCTDRDGTNVFYKYRTLGIKVNATNGGKCDPKDREDKELCPAIPCVVNTPEEDTGNFTECKREVGSYSGKWYKYKTLGIKTPAENGGSCPTEAEREYKVLCPPVPCVVYTPEEDPGKFGECKLESSYSKKWYKYKTLGIKTPEQYGGSCPSKAEREYKELCPPENCIPLSPAEDKGKFGPCTKNSTDGKYYKTKTLGVKVDAKYGGKCDAKDRQYSELCPPVDCVVNTPEEDKGEFSKCKLIDGKYYKTKVLDIKTPAQNGGSCPSETDPRRLVKQLCPSDGWCLPSDPFYDICIPKLAQCGAKKTNIIYSGKTISQTSGLALWQCCDKCATTAGCVAYTFLPDNNPKKTECYLKWEIDDIEYVYGDVVSSEPKSPKKKTCEYHDNRTLVSLISKTLAEYDSDDLDFCCTKCKATRGCKAFVVSSGTCYLESSEGVRVWSFFGSRVGYVG